jgi:hypothetical protein
MCIYPFGSLSKIRKQSSAMVRPLIAIFCLVYTLSCVADGAEFSIEKFAFNVDFSEREQAIQTNDITKLISLNKTTNSSRGIYHLARLGEEQTPRNISAQNQVEAMPDAFYLLYEDCQEVDFCAYFKSQLTRKLTQHFTIADQISLNKVNNRQILCDLDVLKNCEEDWAEMSNEPSIELLPQLVISVKAWQYPNREYAGYEAFVTLVEYGEIVWLADFHIPYKSPRPSLKRLASNIGQILSEQTE